MKGISFSLIGVNLSTSPSERKYNSKILKLRGWKKAGFYTQEINSHHIEGIKAHIEPEERPSHFRFEELRWVWRRRRDRNLLSLELILEIFDHVVLKGERSYQTVGSFGGGGIIILKIYETKIKPKNSSIGWHTRIDNNKIKKAGHSLLQIAGKEQITNRIIWNSKQTNKQKKKKKQR